MRAEETPQQALERLLSELEEHRLTGGDVHVERYREALPGTSALLRDVPLVHGVNDLGGFRGAIENRALRSRHDLGKSPIDAEPYFGLHEVVYMAAGFLYPDRRFAFVLAPGVEGDRKVDASPWDSGSFYRSLCPHLPAASADSMRREVFLAYTLPAPEYRSYLVHYVATCFRSGRDYLTAEMPIFPDPLGAMCKKFTSRVFEVRFGGRVPLEMWSVEMIFVPRDGMDREGLRLRRLLEPFSKKHRVRQYDGARKTLQDTVRVWLLEQLDRAGGAHAS